MSWGSFVKGVRKFASTGAKGVSNLVKKTIPNAYQSVKKGVTPIVNQVYKDVKSVPEFVGRQIDKGTTAASNLVGSVGKGVEGVGEGLGSALKYGAVAAAAVVGLMVVGPMLTKRGRDGQQSSRRSYSSKRQKNY
jgi:hypothetical protein